MYGTRATIALLWLAAAGCSVLPGAPQRVESPAPPPIEPTVSVVPDAVVEAPVPNVWDSIRDGLRFTAESDPRIDSAANWFAQHPQLIAALEPDAERYYAYVVSEVARRGMPMEIALLPIIESTLNPFALSKSGASGIWQLMPDTAQRYGVAMDWWYDGRRDPIDSTRAALDHLQYLREYFGGDWLLAMAAYNCGEGCIARAQSKAERRDRTYAPSFWDLDLGPETSDYVPRILALARIVTRPADYGLDLPAIAPTPPFALTDVERQVDLGEIARLTALDHEELFRLNPGLNRKATPPDGPHRLLVPAELAPDFASLIASHAQTAPRWSRYVVKSGDTIADIARRNQTTIAAIRSSNALRANTIHAGDALVVPARDARALAGNPLLATQTGPATTSYRIAAGDSLASVGRRFDTSTATLKRLNPLAQDGRLRVGDTLRVPATAARNARARTITYRVKPGDSLWQIASRFNVTVQEIARWNGIDATSTLLPGAQLNLEI